MPRVKIDYVVSFSSEDSDNPANNLLAWDVSKKKWLARQGEPSSSVVLQLTKAVQISSVQIGSCHAALVEVLVGLSEKPNDPFKVLVPSCVFLTPMESRRGEGGERVRSFSGHQLADEARGARWDRLRVVCSQPYNKHCKYGISFIHIFEPDSAEKHSEAATVIPSIPTAIPSRLITLETHSSDDEDFKPGELFAKHANKQTNDDKQSTGISTEAQIRQASAQAIKVMSDIMTKLTKTPIDKNTSKHSKHTKTKQHSSRERNSLMYTDEDDKPHDKIDKIVQRHRDEKNDKEKKVAKEILNNSQNKPKKDKTDVTNSKTKDTNYSKHRVDKTINSNNDSSRDKTERHSIEKTRDNLNVSKDDKTPQAKVKDKNESLCKEDTVKDRKRTHANSRKDKNEELRAGPASSSPHRLLRGVVFALSGYVNPERGAVRDAALAMGARYRQDWAADCTHLICAFPNTPKLRAVRTTGAPCVAVTAEWVRQCSAQRRSLPWQWFATEPHLALAIPPPAGGLSPHRSECDTDDEIEKVMRKNKRRRLSSSPNPPPAQDQVDEPSHDREQVSQEMQDADDSVTFVRDERVVGNLTVDDSDTDNTECNDESICKEDLDVKCLPELFEGLTFAISPPVGDVTIDPELIARYVQAYGGLIVDESELDEYSSVDYVLCLQTEPHREPSSRGPLLRADWVWRYHEAKMLCPTENYLISA